MKLLDLSNRALDRLLKFRSVYPQCGVIAVQDQRDDFTRRSLKLWDSHFGSGHLYLLRIKSEAPTKIHFPKERQ